ncbi:DNA/RNA helicase, superfamily II [Candidatus Nitrososphaera evergladensis SR1]|uniref:DNA/RNA helicase, superfamily II n=1 Tax=Candidatus Nitrososphaera evergladensis SR1 TaxID=1459636 RepID=A0A075MPB8_9ARCH|nr:DEAD/DEAH box helicase [Candidatus Nitrososphaera evergladensis]AIF82990.1 DNA/RNA helicase, superfamily II [Candidatus Nitrososphaera evergladensis SR1]
MMKTKANDDGHPNLKTQKIIFTSAFDLLRNPLANDDAIIIKNENPQPPSDLCQEKEKKEGIGEFRRHHLLPSQYGGPAIKSLHFPFALKPDQIKAVEAWMANGQRGSLIYSSGTGKTEIAFECARQAADRSGKQHFRVLLILPRIVLIEQNYRRLVNYGISKEKIGRYFGEQKEIREITLSTYHSVANAFSLVRDADMIIFDEVHLASNTARAFSRIFDIVSKKENGNKALLGLTATIDEDDPRNFTILTVLPPVRKYLIKDAVLDGRLARPVIVPIRVTLTEREQKTYDACSDKIKRISSRFHRHDPQSMMKLLKAGGFPSWQARAWFLNVRKRKTLLASADNKLSRAAELIAEKQRNKQKVMVFSETLESVRKLKQMLKENEIDSMIIDSSMPSFKRQRILSQWGTKFYPLLSVHTLEIGYDVPEVDVEIILASTSNMNQVVQRIGRVIRKFRGKEHAFVYVVYVADTKDDYMFSTFKRAINSAAC